MKILLTGHLPGCTETIALRLLRSGHQVTVLGALEGQPLHKEILRHNVDANAPEALRLIEARETDALIFFFACQSEQGAVRGAMLDALRAMLRQAAREKVGQFILVTDRRAFGVGQMGREEETPIPDTPEGMLIRAAEDCLSSEKTRQMRKLIVRVTSLYDGSSPDSFFADVVHCVRRHKPLIFRGTSETPCDFLHADDLGAFLDFAVGDRIDGVAHVYFGEKYTYGDVEKLLCRRYPDLECKYTLEPARTSTLYGTAMRRLDFVPRHNFAMELSEIQQSAQNDRRKKRFVRVRTRRALVKILPWGEMFFAALIAHAGERLGEANAIFDAIDYKLLFVAIMGNIYGMWFGIVAALLACVLYGLNWVRGGNDLYVLLYNFDHWLPLGCYMLCGTLFGYLHDKSSAQLATLADEKRELEEQNSFLQTMYDLAYQDRSQMQEQVMQFRDSYGRIYSITKALDTLQPEQIYLSTLDILEDVLENRSVAIYVCGDTSAYARLVVHSREMESPQRSLNLAGREQMYRCLCEGRVFANTALLPDCPAYAAPVMSEGRLNSVLMLWEVSFEKRSQHMENLLSILAGLVQSAVVRTQRYFAIMDNIYIEGTHILTDEAFRNALDVYRDIREKRTGQHLLVRVHASASLTIQQYDARIGRATRSTDLTGRLKDEQIYVLFPQADAENLPQIVARFEGQGLKCEAVSMEDLNE